LLIDDVCFIADGLRSVIDETLKDREIPTSRWLKFLVIVFVLVVAAGINTRKKSFSTGVVFEVFRQVFEVRHSVSGCTDEGGFFCKFPLLGAFSVLSLLCREIQGGTSLR
jgi:hypothetical protein